MSSNMGLFSSGIKMVPAITIAEGASANTPVSSAVIDMAGYQGCCFVVQTGPITGTAVTSIKVEQDTVVGMGAAADILGTSVAIADNADNKVFYIDVLNPTEQFLRLVVTRGTEVATVSAMAYLYGGREYPVTHSVAVTGEAHVAAVEGTA